MQFSRFWYSAIFLLLYYCYPKLCIASDTLHICLGESVNLQADTGFATYRWLPLSGLNNPTIAKPVASPQFTSTYVVEMIPANGPDLIVNGNFNNGNTGFTSQYIFSPGANPTQGVYGVFNDANQLSPMYFEHCRDHTSQSGPMMVVDGSPVADQRVWCQTIAVEPNKTYAFSTWLTSILQPNPAALRFSINGNQIGQTFIAGTQNCQWRQFYEIWNSGTAEQAEICIVNRNTNPQGNDFALDDFAFFEVGTTVYDTFTVVVHDRPLTVIDTSFCADETIDYLGTALPVSATFSLRYTSQYGCDSLVQYRAEIIDTVLIVNRIDTLCPGEVITFMGHQVDRDTLLCETVGTPGSCDTTFCLQAVFLTETALASQLQPPTCFAAADGRIQVAVQAGLPPFTYRWEDGSGLPQRTGLTAGFYQLQVTDSKGCTAIKNLELNEPPELKLTALTGSRLCNGSTNGVIDMMASGGTPPYRYSIDNGRQFVAQSRFSGLAPGSYALVLMDAQQCSFSALVEVPPPLTVVLDVPRDTQLRLGESLTVNIADNSPEPLRYEWQPSDGVACPECARTEVRPFTSTTYTIAATDSLGCRIAAHWRVEVSKEQAVFIPNAFSPNGDGINDEFRLYPGLGVEEILDFSIYDRWGNQLYYQQQCAADCAWDGQKNGQLLGRGVYIFLARLRYLDGEVVSLSGEIALMY